MPKEGYERKNISPAERAEKVYYEQDEGHDRRELWNSLIDESQLSEKNKERFSSILLTVYNRTNHGNIASFFERLKTELWDAVVHSRQTEEALAIYRNIEHDFDDFVTELFS